jgi:hypothetical protein
MTHSRALLVLLVVAGLGCTSGPSLPSEAESREAFELREPELVALEAAIRRAIEASGLVRPAMVCDPVDDTVCLMLLGQRHHIIQESEEELQARVSSLHPVCAEVSVVSGATRIEDLRVGVNTCDPGRRGDSVEPEDGVVVSGFHVGRGVYSLAEGDFHPGFAVERTFTLGNATTTMRLFFFTDGTVP